MEDPAPAEHSGTTTEGPRPSATCTDPAAAHLAQFVSDLVRSTPREPGADTLSLLTAVVQQAATFTPGADAASLTLVRSRTPRTLTASDERALQADAIQYELGSGPCLDAAVDDNVFVSNAIAGDERWPEYGPRVSAEAGVASVVAYRLTLLGSEDADAALNVYSTTAGTFDEPAIRAGMLYATQCSLLVSAHLANERAEHLARALESNREIGVAVGVLMHRFRVGRDEAFALLRMASQDANIRIAELASHVADTGELPLRRLRAPRRAGPS
ncbi:GAF and ANTAR domain-containing protein [Nostocoides sp. Soil756]|uniref:GAF and ANTAR domain-containing protein n=1 Tax=Nostocoides sp. Soil756 TaxID=1736399 RepID=UPI0006F5C15D|nr:GAF and ANTAR domain-containing protein [Tetrasphaera sp. Soil756]KRE60814.1 hypothetical protein ASG78_10515 [Tetrasphaera sp. Soil756]